MLHYCHTEPCIWIDCIWCLLWHGGVHVWSLRPGVTLHAGGNRRVFCTGLLLNPPSFMAASNQLFLLLDKSFIIDNTCCFCGVIVLDEMWISTNGPKSPFDHQTRIIVKHEHLQASCFCTFTQMDLSGFGSAAAVVMWNTLCGCIFLIHACYVCQLYVCMSHELAYLHTSAHRNWWYLKMFGVVSSHFAYFKPFRVLLCVRGNVSVCLCTNSFLQCICRGTTTLVCS